VRRKYARDAEFRAGVDRYVDDFEHLLNEASRTERGKAAIPGYLNSDTGRIYTLLAHSAGRLE
jgi:alpha-beta hydrolase superfamily lysophospholipase